MKIKTLACLTLLALLDTAVFAAISNAPASCAISSPRGSATGMLTAAVAVADPDGLRRVSLVFVPSGDPLVLCDDMDSRYPACTGTSGSWPQPPVDPTSYGVTSDGPLTVGLWVKGDLGWTSLVAQETIDYTIGDGSSGQIREPSGTYAATSVAIWFSLWWRVSSYQ